MADGSRASGLRLKLKELLPRLGDQIPDAEERTRGSLAIAVNLVKGLLEQNMKERVVSTEKLTLATVINGPCTPSNLCRPCTCIQCSSPF